jgi:hypothetical protein
MSSKNERQPSRQYIRSAETRERMSAAHRGRPLTPKHKRAISQSMRRADVRQRIASALRGRKLSKQHRAAISAAKRAVRRG